MAQIIEMPKLSDTMTVGTLVKWLKKEGDVITAGTMLAEVETDKATMELECFYDGTLLKIFAPAGTQLAIGAPLCAVGKPGENVEAPAGKPASPAAAKEEPKKDAPKSESAPAPAKAPESVPQPETKPAAAAHSAPARADGERVKISPLAKKLAAEKGIDPSRVTGSGPGGRIVRADVLAAEKSGSAKAGSAKPAATGAPSTPFTGGAVSRTGPIQEERAVPVSNMRAVIAKRMVESTTTIPYIYVDIEIDAEPLLAVRQQLNTGLEKEGVKLSVNDFVLKACAEALRRVPAVNSSWEGNQIRYFGAAHVAFAVALDDGLITPVVKDAHQKSVFQISIEAKALGKKAKDKKLAPAEYTGGTFCVSNLGMMGIPKFTAIINPPNSAILAVGAAVAKPVIKNGQIVSGQTMTVTLSGDHRVFDGAVGAQFLNALKTLIESPALLLV
ncbi:pyruvate dehydrogenase complex dihydrolipoamide acetyltransferase [Nibricoccus aquaticus]|uniref:Acetyltransferase component of pyruvate dehydrogenase complex n=1 Tax=Nibricoccus aquaticus TaxID=2576891 RepID=A0A290Q1J3_9BACT|nr:pyruvate dehydrogenase complex dihydrolipoamide acetyltransferase [Nibricoccus aquaticus]ATC62499.1 pyruvate dehydrogenase complex dihydrolipoamide acetyltransferase [Nibricoccus aquaticus]